MPASSSKQKMGSITHNSAEVNRGSGKGMLSKLKGSFISTGGGQSVKSGKTTKSAKSGKTAASKKNGLTRSLTSQGSNQGSKAKNPVIHEYPQSVAPSDVRSTHTTSGIPTSITALVDAASCMTDDMTQQPPNMLGMDHQNNHNLRGSSITYGSSNAASRALANLHISGASGDHPHNSSGNWGRRNSTGYSSNTYDGYEGNEHADYYDESGGGIFDDAYMQSATRISVSAPQPPPPDGGYNRRSSNAQEYMPDSRGYNHSRRVSNAEESGYFRRSSEGDNFNSHYRVASDGDAYSPHVNHPVTKRHSMDNSGCGQRSRRASVDYNPRQSVKERQSFRDARPTNNYVNNTGRGDSVTTEQAANRPTPSAKRQGSMRMSQNSQFSKSSQFSKNNPTWFNEKGDNGLNKQTSFRGSRRFSQEDDDRTMATMATMATKAQALKPSAMNKAKDMSSPAGEVTIVFTDVQGSTSLWETCPSDMKRATDIHDIIMRQCYTDHSGYEINTEGDAFNLAFQHPVDALAFALQAQLKLYKADWPEGILRHPDGKDEPALKFRGFRVRFGIHHGPTSSRVHEMTGRMVYSGEGVKIAKAVEGMCHGGQILTTMESWKAVSGMAERYLGRPQLLDCGEHLLFETKNPNPSGGGHTTTRYTRRIMQLVPADLAFDFFEARGRRDVTSEEGKTGFEIKDASTVDGRLFPPLTSKRQLTTCFLNAPYANGRVTICFVYTVGLDDNPDNRAKNLVVLAKYLRKQLLVLNPPGYECQEDNGCWMLAFDRMAHAVTFGLALKATLQNAEDLVGSVDREGMFKVGILSGPFTSMGPHKTTGMADYFGPIVNRAARVASNCEPGQVCVGIPLSAGVTADPPDFGEMISVKLLGIKKLKGITLDVACFECTKRRIEKLY